MVGKTNAGGGGGGLNFRVIGGTSTPENHKENDIWVNTDTEITSWAFSATEPESPTEGMVWISTGQSSSVEFNALKKNGIQVYPIAAKQYISSALVYKEAKIYQNGEWVDWVLYLFKDGNQYNAITGGWTQIAMSGKMQGTVSFSGGNIVLTAMNDQQAAGTAAACKSFDGKKLAGRNHLRIVVSKRTAYSSVAEIFVRIYDTTSLTKKLAEVSIPDKGEYTIPLEGIDSGQVVLVAYMGTLSVSEIEVV